MVPTIAFQPATADTPKRTHVIAEIGVNHDGQLDRAKTLVDAAAEAGADSVKCQLFDPRTLLSNQAMLAGYQQGKAPNPFDLLDGLKLDPKAMAALGEHTHQAGLGFIVTPFSLTDAVALQDLPVTAVKIASPDAVNGPLVEQVLAVGLPVIVSTGTCTLDELTPTAELLKAQPPGVDGQGNNATTSNRTIASNRQHALMHCVSAYPTPLNHAQLGGIRSMAEHFGLPTGYSDHTPSLLTGGWAAAAGAVLLEKHLTWDTTASGPDHAASLNPSDLKQYIQHVRQADAAMGWAQKQPGVLEQDVKTVSRQSVCLVHDRPAGHVLTAADLTLKRPGTGLPPHFLKTLPGKQLTRDIAANNLLQPADIAE